MRTDAVHVGDFIYCRSKYYRDQLQLSREPALVIEIKRNSFKVLYANDKRCWLPRETFTKLNPPTTFNTFLERLYFIIKKVAALECEVAAEGNLARLSLRIEQLDHNTVDELREFLGEAFESLIVIPEGMAFMQSEIRFRK